MLMEEMTMTEFEKGLEKTKTVIIPVGSVEEHGSHLPLSTDTMQAIEVARRVSERIDVFVTPPLHFGVCRSTRSHPGTITISGGTLRAMIRDIVKSLHSHGLRSFLILSGHAGNIHMGALNEVGEELLEEIPGINMAIVSGLDLLLDEGGLIETEGDSHAGEAETSMILSIHPELVKGSAPEEYPSFPKPILVRDKRNYWPGGVWGDPSKASREKGEKLTLVAVEKVVDVIKRLEEQE